MPGVRRIPNGSKSVGRSSLRRCGGLQVCSHSTTFYAIVSFAVVIQPQWLSDGGTSYSIAIGLFWTITGITFALYFFVVFGDIRYRGGSTLNKDETEGRRCEECSTVIQQARVKHCQSCSQCVAGFDHHCRYLNVCIGSRTYVPWVFFRPWLDCHHDLVLLRRHRRAY